MSKFQDYQKFVNNHPSLKAIGNTPIVQLDLPFEIGKAQLFAKCENLNPGGSIKDRPIMTMIVQAILSGKLDKSNFSGSRLSMVMSLLPCFDPEEGKASKPMY